MPHAAAAHGYEMCYVHVLRDYLQREFEGADWSKVRPLHIGLQAPSHRVADSIT